MSAPIIRYFEDDNGDQVFDEFVANNATVHFEAMGECSWWIGVEVDGRTWHINVGAVSNRVKGYANCEDVTA